MRAMLFLVIATVFGLPSAAGRADEPITSLRVDGDFSREVGRCRYSASIHGTVLPVEGGSESAPAVEPQIDVQANVACPEGDALRIADDAMAVGPLTIDQLTRALQRRATVALTSARTRCVYVPELTLSDNGELALQSVGTDCP